MARDRGLLTMGDRRSRPGRAPAPPHLLLWGIGIWLIGGWAPSILAASEQIADLTVSIQPQEITLSAALVDAMPDAVGEEIRQGISKDLYYYAVLKRKIPFWIDEELASATVRFRIRYDLVKKEFVVAHRQGETETRQTAEQFTDVRRLISHLRGVTIPLSIPLRRDDTYYVSVKAEMRSVKLPVYIEYVLFFLPTAQLTTPWTDSAPFTAGRTRTP